MLTSLGLAGEGTGLKNFVKELNNVDLDQPQAAALIQVRNKSSL